MLNRIIALTLILFGALLILGCGADAPTMTEKEKKNFKGGPMPAGTWDKIIATQQRSIKNTPNIPDHGPINPNPNK